MNICVLNIVVRKIKCPYNFASGSLSIWVRPGARSVTRAGSFFALSMVSSRTGRCPQIRRLAEAMMLSTRSSRRPGRESTCRALCPLEVIKYKGSMNLSTSLFIIISVSVNGYSYCGINLTDLNRNMLAITKLFEVLTNLLRVG